jgi:hypothetical protein
MHINYLYQHISQSKGNDDHIIKCKHHNPDNDLFLMAVIFYIIYNTYSTVALIIIMVSIIEKLFLAKKILYLNTTMQNQNW